MCGGWIASLSAEFDEVRLQFSGLGSLLRTRVRTLAPRGYGLQHALDRPHAEGLLLLDASKCAVGMHRRAIGQSWRVLLPVGSHRIAITTS